MAHPLGNIYFMLWEKTDSFETLRINGDRLRIESYLKSLENSPHFRLEYLEPLHKVPGSWSVLLTAHLLPVAVEK